jgi:hypothetical protein
LTPDVPEVLERLVRSRVDQLTAATRDVPRAAAVIGPEPGHDFAAAGEQEQAVRYFEMAGDHALRAFANDEAVTLFRSALDIAKPEKSGSAAVSSAALRLWAKLPQLLWRLGRRAESRDELSEAIRAAGGADAVRSAPPVLTFALMEVDEHDEVVAIARKALAAAVGGGDESETYRENGPGATAWEAFFLGWYLVMRGDLKEAENHLHSSSAVAEQPIFCGMP